MPQAVFRQRKKVLVGIGLVAVVALLAGLNFFRLNQKEVIEVKTAVVTKGTIASNVFATGKVVVPDQVGITARVNGIVAEINVNPGDQVKAGQVLLRFDDQDLALELAQAEAALQVARTQSEQQESQTQPALEQAKLAYESAATNLARSRELYDAGAISLEQLEAAELEANLKKSQYEAALNQANASRVSAAAQIKQAEAAWQMAVRRMEAAVVVAPQDGTILDCFVEKGQFVSMGTPLFSCGNLTTLEIESEISEVDAPQLAVGQAVEISGEALGAETYRGTVKQIAPAAVRQVNSQGEQTIVLVTIAIQGKTGLLKPGYNVDLNITTASRESTLLLPYEAVVETEDGTAVYVVKDGVARKRTAKTGISDELHVEILEGAAEGEVVVLDPPETLKDGALVRIND